MTYSVSGLLITNTGEFFFIGSNCLDFVSSVYVPVTGNLITYNKRGVMIHMGFCLSRYSCVIWET